MTAFGLVVVDTDRRRRRPLAVHDELTKNDASELMHVYAAIGYEDTQLVLTLSEAAEAA